VLPYARSADSGPQDTRLWAAWKRCVSAGAHVRYFTICARLPRGCSAPVAQVAAVNLLLTTTVRVLLTIRPPSRLGLFALRAGPAHMGIALWTRMNSGKTQANYNNRVFQ
jgi:hypothetical protein